MLRSKSILVFEKNVMFIYEILKSYYRTAVFQKIIEKIASTDIGL